VRKLTDPWERPGGAWKATPAGEECAGGVGEMQRGLLLGLGVLVLATSGGWAAHEGDGVPFADAARWKTNFQKHTVPLREIREGGPPRDGIPSVDRPQFDTVAEARRWLGDQEPVVLVERTGDARAYPVQILVWHEIVNDVVGGEPLAVTFCPLCNAAIAFRRRVGGLVLDFGTTGKLRYSDLVMYDRQTESWWQQMTGEAIVGQLAGTRLEAVPAQGISWAEFARAHPAGRVLNRNTGHRRPYGRNPYVGYDNVGSLPFLYDGPPTDRRLRPMERVVALSLGGEAVAYPLEVLRRVRVLNDQAGALPVVVWWAPGTASALDREDIALSRDVGSAGVFDRRVEGRVLTFAFRNGRFEDRETGTTWDLLGRATKGRLEGKRLQPVVHGTYFWFAWAAFQPHTRVVRR
jgi:hypothetical protein